MIKRLFFLFLLGSITTLIQANKGFALLIGVEYEGKYILDYTQQDAITLGQILKNNFGYTTKVLTKKSETTKTAIVKAFSDLKAVSSNYDQIIIFFSGHGEKDKSSSEIGYLLPNNFDQNDLLGSAIDMSIFQNLSKTLQCKQILFILDCCYSGIIGSYANMDISGGEKTLRARQVLTAGRSNQKAQMYETKGLSLYTYFLTRALSRDEKFIRADSDKDGELTAWDLQDYVRRKVAQQTNEQQTPRIYNYTEDDGIFLFQYPVFQKVENVNSGKIEKTKSALNKGSLENEKIKPKTTVKNTNESNSQRIKPSLPIGLKTDRRFPLENSKTFWISPSYIEQLGHNRIYLDAKSRREDGSIYNPLKIFWQSSDPYIAKIDSLGVVIPKQSGTVTITATTFFYSAHTIIKILDYQWVGRNDIQFLEKYIRIKVGDSYTLSVKSPLDNPQNSSIYSSDNSVVAVVQKKFIVKYNSLEIIGKSPGKATISISRSVNTVTVEVVE